MKITLFIIGLFSLATLTNAGTFLEAKHKRISGEYLSPETLISNLKSSDFGKNVLSLVSLQFRTSGKLDDVNTLISDLQTKLSQQQSDEDNQYTVTTASNAQVIQDQANIVVQANVNIQNAQQQISDAQTELAQLQSRQALLQQENELLVSQIAQYTDIRARDAASFAKRLEDSQALINGLQRTETVFQTSVTNGQYDAATIAKINGLLQGIQAAFTASIAQDQQQENQAIQNLEDFVTSANNRIAVIADELQAIALETTRLVTLVGQLNDTITAQTTVRDNAQALHDRTVQAQADLDANYNHNKAVRADQLRLLANAIVTLNSNSADVQSYLNQA